MFPTGDFLKLTPPIEVKLLMEETVFLDYPDMEAVPTAHRIAELAESTPHLVLRFPTQFEIVSSHTLTTRELTGDFLQRLVEELRPLLPNHSIFDAGGIYDPEARKNVLQLPVGARISGTSRLSLLRVVSEEEVLAHADALVQAAQRFRQIATELAGRLASKLNVSLEAFSNQEFEWDFDCDSSCDDCATALDEEWTYWFHGCECLFSSAKTGAYVEIILGFGDEFGVLDPYFFAKFLQSIPEFRPLAQQFQHEYHDTARAFEILEKHGMLSRTKTTLSDRTGLIASLE